MAFSETVKHEIMVKSARHCCVCHRSKGLNIEVHHITPKGQGGDDSADNAIALCFDHHADAGHYFAGHPKGSKLSPAELKKHKESWFSLVSQHKIENPKIASVEISIMNKDYPGFFSPVFIRETTIYTDRNSMRKMFEFMGKNPDSYVEEFKARFPQNDIYGKHKMSKIKTYDDLMEYFNGDMEKEDREKPNTDPQPHKFELSPFMREYKVINKSNCVLYLKLTNGDKDVLEDYKLYLNFENVIEADSVTKRSKFFDDYKYSYNVFFPENNRGEFIPARPVLVQNDSVTLDAICFRPDPKAKFVNLNWELFARGVFGSGTIRINIKSSFEQHIRERHVEPSEIKPKFIRILPKWNFE
ncbi:MAG: HNH endonuclease [Chitinophagaceae bacterium]|nr:HNH endonuclease [Chitinophagaceae bacterium]